jgi:hypothetical protein
MARSRKNSTARKLPAVRRWYVCAAPTPVHPAVSAAIQVCTGIGSCQMCRTETRPSGLFGLRKQAFHLAVRGAVKNDYQRRCDAS